MLLYKPFAPFAPMTLFAAITLWGTTKVWVFPETIVPSKFEAVTLDVPHLKFIEPPCEASCMTVVLSVNWITEEVIGTPCHDWLETKLGVDTVYGLLF